MCVSLSLYIYIYIEREREIDIHTYTMTKYTRAATADSNVNEHRHVLRHSISQHHIIQSIPDIKVTLRRSALSVCPRGDPWGTLLRLEINYSRAPSKTTRGQPLRSPRPKVTSVLTRWWDETTTPRS